MRIVCNQCSHEHIIPDESISNRKVYFYCKNCAHKIIIKGKSDQGTFSTSGNINVRQIPTIANIFDAIPRFLNLNSFLISFIFIIFTIIIGALIMLLVTNLSLITDYPVIIAVLVVLLSTFLLYSYAFVTYTVSKIHYYMLSNPALKTIDWKFIYFDVKEDAVVLFIFSSGIQLLTLILFIPVILLEDYGIAYSSVMFIPLSFCVFSVIFTILLHEFIPAMIAIPSLPIVAQCLNVFRFIRREIVNMPLYMITVAGIYSVASIIIVTIFSGALLITVSTSAVLSGDSLKNIAAQLIPAITGLFSSKFQTPAVLPDHISVSLIVMVVFIFILCTSLFAVLYNLRIALVAQSCWIMNENREYSIPRNVLAAGFIIIFCVIFAALFYSVLKAVHLF